MQEGPKREPRQPRPGIRSSSAVLIFPYFPFLCVALRWLARRLISLALVLLSIWSSIDGFGYTDSFSAVNLGGGTGTVAGTDVSALT